MSISLYLESVRPMPEPLVGGAFHFVRHGRTDHNLRQIAQGHLDIALDDMGRAQASATAELLVDGAISRIVSSDLARARETAERIGARLGLSPELDPDLRERCFGPFEGHPAEPDLWGRTADGMETLEDFAARVCCAFARHIDGPAVLIIAHGGVLRVVARLLQAELPADGVRNAAPLHFFRSNTGWTVTDLESLAPIKQPT